MQWVIDIAIDAMQQYLIDNPRFVDRGDPAAVDWTEADFIKDGAWRELDLSGKVGTNAVAVALAVEISHGNVGLEFSLREAGNANDKNIAKTNIQVAWDIMAADVIVALSADKKIEYKFSPMAGWTTKLTVKGWWL